MTSSGTAEQTINHVLKLQQCLVPLPGAVTSFPVTASGRL